MSTVIDKLEARVSQLLHISEQLRDENLALRNEKTALKEKNELARTKVETIIGRLKEMEQEKQNG